MTRAAGTNVTDASTDSLTEQLRAENAVSDNSDASVATNNEG